MAALGGKADTDSVPVSLLIGSFRSLVELRDQRIDLRDNFQRSITTFEDYVLIEYVVLNYVWNPLNRTLSFQQFIRDFGRTIGRGRPRLAAPRLAFDSTKFVGR